MSKKVTLIHVSYPPEKGAAPTRIYNLSRLLQVRNYDVQVITAMPNYPLGRIFKGYRNKLIHKENKEGIKINRLWIYPSNSRNPLKRIVSMFSYSFSLYTIALPGLLRHRQDLVIVSSPPILSAYAGIIIAKLAGSKAVLNVSDLWPSTALELGAIKKGTFYRISQFVERRMYKLAHAYIGQSQEILDHIRDTVPHNKRTFLYRNLQPNSVFADKQRPEGRKKIVYAGLLGVAQGVYEICRHIDFGGMGVEFHIYGDGVEKDAILELIKKHPERSIFYHETIPASMVPEMLSQYHATLIPLVTHIKGAVPSKIFMAMANGLPVFFCGSGEAADIVKKSKMGWVNSPADYKTLEQNIQYFVEMSDKAYDLLRENCLTMALTTYNKEVQDDAFDGFLRSLSTP